MYTYSITTPRALVVLLEPLQCPQYIAKQPLAAGPIFTCGIHPRTSTMIGISLAP